MQDPDFGAQLLRLGDLAVTWIEIGANRWGALFLAYTIAAWGATRLVKDLIVGYWLGRLKIMQRPWFYNAALRGSALVFGTLAALVYRGSLAQREALLVGLSAGLASSVSVKIFRAVAKKIGSKTGVDLEQSSSDLTLEPMKAVRTEEHSTDPVVTDPSKEP